MERVKAENKSSSSDTASSKVNVTESHSIAFCPCRLFTICNCVTVIIHSLLKEVAQITLTLLKKSHHLLPCCVVGIAFHVPAGLRYAIVAPLACERYHKNTAA